MRQLTAWSLSAAVTTSLAGSAAAAEPPSAPPAERPSWFGRLLGRSDEKPPESERTFGSVGVRPPVVLGPMDPVVMAEALKAEQAAYQRRLDVCLRLREIAAGQNDDRLAQQALDLERQATALFHQRAARLGVKASLRHAEEVLDRTLGSGAAVTPLTVEPPRPATGPATASTRRFREVPRD